MNKTVFRDDLQALVWSEPLRTLASKFEISDVAVREACQRAAVPTPERGYWAKHAAGKSVMKAALALRPLGLNHEFSFGEHRRWHHPWTREEVLGRVDKVSDPEPDGCDKDEAEEAIAGLVVSGGR